jgi:DNA-binding MarR family transcriptional regulator
LSTQVSSLRGAAFEAWVGFLRAQAAVIRELNADLVREQGLTINDYEVLLHLSRAPERSLRRVDLADRVIITASGITRLLAGLERAGWVERAECASDARVTYAKLTDAGYQKLKSASRTHLAGVHEYFAGRFDDEELETLARLFARLPGSEAEGDDECGPP